MHLAATRLGAVLAAILAILPSSAARVSMAMCFATRVCMVPVVRHILAALPIAMDINRYSDGLSRPSLNFVIFN